MAALPRFPSFLVVGLTAASLAGCSGGPADSAASSASAPAPSASASSAPSESSSAPTASASPAATVTVTATPTKTAEPSPVPTVTVTKTSDAEAPPVPVPVVPPGMSLHTFANGGVTAAIPTKWTANSEGENSANFTTTGGARYSINTARGEKLDTSVLSILEHPGYIKSEVYSGTSSADPSVRISVIAIYSPGHGKMMLLETATNSDWGGLMPQGGPKVIVSYIRDLPDPQGSLTESDVTAIGKNFIESPGGQESLSVLNTVKVNK